VPQHLLGKPQLIAAAAFQPCGKNYKGVLLTGMRVDLNADVGEGRIGELGQDPSLMPHITSANVACGFHAGGPAVMRATVALAAAHNVAVGAHPGFPDLEGFGRRELDVTPRDVEDFVVYQIGALAAIAAAQAVRLQHVKPHGALFNMAVRDASLADAVARATAVIDRNLILFGLPGSELIAAGWRAGLRTACEGFADRAYRADGSLVPRQEPGAVVHDAETVVQRAVRMARDRTIEAADGTVMPVLIDTICVHGDTPGAADLAARIRRALLEAGVEVKALRSG
jgi:5-oxoprolinase (ATP-hydrolysing) subunit A